eukprot:gene28817-32006_t
MSIPITSENVDRYLRVATEDYRRMCLERDGVPVKIMFEEGFNTFLKSEYGRNFRDFQWDADVVMLTAHIVKGPKWINYKRMQEISVKWGVLCMFHDKEMNDIVCRSINPAVAHNAISDFISVLKADGFVIDNVRGIHLSSKTNAF